MALLLFRLALLRGSVQDALTVALWLLRLDEKGTADQESGPGPWLRLGLLAPGALDLAPLAARTRHAVLVQALGVQPVVVAMVGKSVTSLWF